MGIIFSSSELVYKTEQGHASALTAEQRSKLEQYQKNYGVRKVSLYTFPNPQLGLKHKTGHNPAAANLIVSTELSQAFDRSQCEYFRRWKGGTAFFLRSGSIHINEYGAIFQLAKLADKGIVLGKTAAISLLVVVSIPFLEALSKNMALILL